MAVNQEVFELITDKVGRREDQEYQRLLDPQSPWGESLRPLAVRNFKRFVGVLYYLIAEKEHNFDLIVGAGDSGVGMARLSEMVYQQCNIPIPRILNLPIARFKYGFDLYDNSVLIPEAKKQLKDTKNLEHILVVDDEISHGVTLKAAVEVILGAMEEKVSSPLNVTCVAEDQDFDSQNFMEQVELEVYPFAKPIEGLFSVVSYIVPWEIEKQVREHFNDQDINSKVLLNILLDLPAKEREPVKDIMLPKAEFTYKYNELVKHKVSNFDQLQSRFRECVIKWINEAINEYTLVNGKI